MSRREEDSDGSETSLVAMETVSAELRTRSWTIETRVSFKRKYLQILFYFFCESVKTSLSAWINIWFNPGFLMQSEAPRAGGTFGSGLRLPDEVGFQPPGGLKGSAGIPSRPFSFGSFTHRDGNTLMCEIDSSSCWSLASSFQDPRPIILPPPPQTLWGGGGTMKTFLY